MATLAQSVQLQIDALDAQLSTISPTSVGSDGTSITNPDWISLSNQRLKLEQVLNRINGTNPMLVRGMVTGLRRR